jgi:transcriptional regulator with XRE-family HTH domain
MSLQEIKDFELEIRVRNNRLKRLRLSLGLSQLQLCKALDIGANYVGEFETLKRDPVKDEEWTDLALKIAEFFEQDPEYVFPESVRKVKKPYFKSEINPEDFGALIQGTKREQVLLPEDAVAEKELLREIEKQLGELTPREERILKKRYGIDGHEEKTLAEVSIDEGVTRERIREIEAKALGKLRHPSRANRIINAIKGGKEVLPVQDLENESEFQEFISKLKDAKKRLEIKEKARKVVSGWHPPDAVFMKNGLTNYQIKSRPIPFIGMFGHVYGTRDPYEWWIINNERERKRFIENVPKDKVLLPGEEGCPWPPAEELQHKWQNGDYAWILYRTSWLRFQWNNNGFSCRDPNGGILIRAKTETPAIYDPRWY